MATLEHCRRCTLRVMLFMLLNITMYAILSNQPFQSLSNGGNIMSRSIESILRDEIFAELEIEYPDDYDTNLLDQGIDSVSFIKLIVAMEAKFNIAIPDEELLFENFSTTRLILHYLTEKAVT